MAVMFLLTACGNQEDSKTKIVLTTGFSENEVFKIGSSSCDRSEIMVYLTNMQNQYEAVYGDQIWSRSINGETLEDKVKNVVLARLAQIKTMNLLAESRQVTLSEEENAAVLSAAETYFSSLNDTEVEKLGLTEKKTEDMYREYALANKIYDLIIQDTNPEISDDEARTVTLEQIMIKTYSQDGDGNRTPYTDASKALAKQRAENILRKLQSGEDFDTLAQTYNEESSITVSFGKGEKPKAIEDAAFDLGNGEISSLIETDDGYYILKCISTLDREQTDANKQKIMEKRKEEAFSQIYDEFLQTQIRNLNEKLWKEISFIHDEAVTTKTFFDVYNEKLGSL